MLKLELPPPPQKTRPPPAPAFSAPFTAPALKWARRKRQRFSNELPHSRRQRHGRRASSSPDPPGNDRPSPPYPHSRSPSPSPSPNMDKPPIRSRTPRKEEDNEGGVIVGRKALGKPVILALAAASRGNGNGAATAGGGGGVGGARSLRPRGAAGGRQRRAELWVSLSREEIEEDYYSITGGRLPRRQKRRPRTLPPHLADQIFPGSWLPSTVVAEMYKVPDPAESKKR